MQPPETEPATEPSIQNGEHRAFRPRRRTPRPHNGHEQHAPAAFDPARARLQYFEIDAIHKHIVWLPGLSRGSAKSR
jgi:hypothetical protein